jgi:hypothetical protein
MTDQDNLALLRYRFVDTDRVAAVVTYEQGLGFRCLGNADAFAAIAVGALMREGDHLFCLLSPQHVNYLIEVDCLSNFLCDPSVRDFLRQGQPIFVVFDDHSDYRRLHSMVAALPLTNNEETCLDRADKARDDHADDADYEPAGERDYDDEPTWGCSQ